MLDHILNEILLAHLKTVPALATLNGYTGQDNAEHKLPAVADRINDALLSFVNDANAEAEAFFNHADARGIFWRT